MTEIYILGAERTAIGSFGGSISSFSPTELGTFAAKAAIERAGLAPADVDNSVYGAVIPIKALAEQGTDLCFFANTLLSEVVALESVIAEGKGKLADLGEELLMQ